MGCDRRRGWNRASIRRRRPAASAPISSSTAASRRLVSTPPAAGRSPGRSAACSRDLETGAREPNRFQASAAASSSAPMASGGLRHQVRSGPAVGANLARLARIDQPFTPEAVTISPDGTDRLARRSHDRNSRREQSRVGRSIVARDEIWEYRSAPIRECSTPRPGRRRPMSRSTCCAPGISAADICRRLTRNLTPVE